MTYPQAIERLINTFKKLPGIGPKSAERIVLYLVDSKREFLQEFAENILGIIDKVNKCKFCFAITEKDVCSICSSDLRNKELLCVVETYKDMLMIENIGEYDGLYHVLEGRLSPVKNVRPEDIRVKELIERLKRGGIKEVIIATSPNLEGDATGFYIAQEIKKNNIDVKVTRLAKGLPAGGDIEFADRLSLLSSLKNREEIKV